MVYVSPWKVCPQLPHTPFWVHLIGTAATVLVTCRFTFCWYWCPRYMASSAESDGFSGSTPTLSCSRTFLRSKLSCYVALNSPNLVNSWETQEDYSIQWCVRVLEGVAFGGRVLAWFCVLFWGILRCNEVLILCTVHKIVFFSFLKVVPDVIVGKKKGGGAQPHYNAHLFQEGFPTCIAAPDPLGGAGEVHSSLDPLSFFS